MQIQRWILCMLIACGRIVADNRMAHNSVPRDHTILDRLYDYHVACYASKAVALVAQNTHGRSCMSSASDMPRIFVSHSHLDDDFGLQLVRDLRQTIGDDSAVWYDSSEGLHPGDPFFTKIAQEVLHRPVFLVIVSPDSMASRPVQDEVSLAWNQRISPAGKLIIPVLYRSAIPFGFLQVLQYVSFLPPRSYADAFQELCKAIGMFPRQASSTAPIATVRVAPDASALVQETLPRIEAAFQVSDWDDVIRKGELLNRDAAGAVPFAVYSMLGQAYLRKLQVENAHTTFAQALAINNRDITTLKAAAQACRLLNRNNEAEPMLERALAIAGERMERLALLHEYAETLASLGQWGKVLDRANEALGLTPGDRAWLGVRLRALIQERRYGEAMPLALDLTSRRDATAEDWLLRARAEAGHSQKQAARASLENAKRLAPDSQDVAATYLYLFPVAEAHFPESLERLGYTPGNYQGIEVLVPPVCPIPAGDCVLGEDSSAESDARRNEHPAHTVSLPGFYISRFPVTVAEYACFVRAGGREPPALRDILTWSQQLLRPDHPVVCLTWYDVVTYATWLARTTSQPWRLLTEAEWEKAARWGAGLKQPLSWPWGDAFDDRRCNTLNSTVGSTSYVGAYPNGVSRYGVWDMIGNVWEWTSSLARPFPYTFDDGRDELDLGGRRIVRGGSWGNEPFCARPSYRDELDPRLYDDATGFRLAYAATPLDS